MALPSLVASRAARHSLLVRESGPGALFFEGSKSSTRCASMTNRTVPKEPFTYISPSSPRISGPTALSRQSREAASGLYRASGSVSSSASLRTRLRATPRRTPPIAQAQIARRDGSLSLTSAIASPATVKKVTENTAPHHVVPDGLVADMAFEPVTHEDVYDVVRVLHSPATPPSVAVPNVQAAFGPWSVSGVTMEEEPASPVRVRPRRRCERRPPNPPARRAEQGADTASREILRVEIVVPFGNRSDVWRGLILRSASRLP